MKRTTARKPRTTRSKPGTISGREWAAQQEAKKLAAEAVPTEPAPAALAEEAPTPQAQAPEAAPARRPRRPRQPRALSTPAAADLSTPAAPLRAIAGKRQPLQADRPRRPRRPRANGAASPRPMVARQIGAAALLPPAVTRLAVLQAARDLCAAAPGAEFATCLDHLQIAVGAMEVR